MQRFFGAIAIFCGWVSMPIGAAAGLMFSQFFGVGHVEGAGPPVDVYGVSVIIVFCVYASASLVSAVPLLLVVTQPDPRRELRIMAGVLAVVGAALLGSELGRAFGLPLLAGAACLWVAGDLLHEDYLATSSASSPAPEAELTATIQTATAEDSQVPSAQAGPAVADSPGPLSPPVSPAGPPPASATGERSRRGRRKTSVATERVCPWCSTAVPARQAACPSCGATLDGSAADQVAIPGLTEVPPDLRRYAEKARAGKKRPNLLKTIFSDTPIPTAIDAPPPSDADALRPPSAAVRAEMARLDLEIAAGLAPQPGDDARPATPQNPAPEPAGGEPRT